MGFHDFSKKKFDVIVLIHYPFFFILLIILFDYSFPLLYLFMFNFAKVCPLYRSI